LKQPLGLLIRGSFDQTSEKLKELIRNMKPSKIISVGDKVSEIMIKSGIHPNILIVDNRVMRKPITPITADTEETLRLKNPPGTITDEAWQVIQEALKKDKKVRIVVEGEEDLLTLVAALRAPENSVVIYGQPREGVVVIKVTEKAKRTLSKIVDQMEHRD